LTAEFCSLELEVCEYFLELFADLSTDSDNMDRIKSYLTHMPSGAGYRNLVHYGQLVETTEFLRYDYGYVQNL